MQKATLENGMAGGIAARTRKISQRESRRAHQLRMDELRAELAEVARDSKRLEIDLDTTHDSVRRSQARLSEPPRRRPAPPTTEAAEAMAVEAGERLTAVRASLLRELLHLQDEVWCDVSVDDEIEELLNSIQPFAGVKARGCEPPDGEAPPVPSAPPTVAALVNGGASAAPNREPSGGGGSGGSG